MPKLREMYMSDLGPVLKIIKTHDEDDAEAAESDYQDDGVENQFVYEKDEKIIAVTGYREIEATDATFWLSWTYVEKSLQGQGLGKKMLTEVLDKMRQRDGRKVFVKVSDYVDPEEGKIYERAFKLYESLGFKEEVVNKDFYDEGENQHILGLYLKGDSSEDSDEKIDVVDEKPIIRFNGLHEIAETDGAYTFSWIVQDTKKLFGHRNFTIQDLRVGLESVKEEGGRKLFLTFPSNLPLVHKPLQAVGFKYIGLLVDYYEQGVHEYHFVHNLEDV